MYVAVCYCPETGAPVRYRGFPVADLRVASAYMAAYRAANEWVEDQAAHGLFGTIQWRPRPKAYGLTVDLEKSHCVGKEELDAR